MNPQRRRLFQRPPLPEIESWPQGKRFAFTVFDDPDAQTLKQSQEIYALLHDLGMRTTKAVWMLEPPARNSGGETCDNPEFRNHVLKLRATGFEIGYHNGAPGDLSRADAIRALDAFRAVFGDDPVTMANHYNADALYWGPERLTGLRRTVYRAATRGSKTCFHGSDERHQSFWGDVCRQRIRYCRNFVVRDINTLRAFPFMPYYDESKPYVRAWYGSSEGANCFSLVRQLNEAEQERLEQEGGACIMYTHFGHHYFDAHNRLNPQFVRLMTRLAGKSGWFVPVGTVLDYLCERHGIRQVRKADLSSMEWRWLIAKLRYGTS